jgi:large subunit ribosomal protein L3
MKSIVGKKVGMTQVFNENGDCLPVTLVCVDRCVPVLSKTAEKDGYKSVLVAYGNRKESRTNKPLKGFYDKHKIDPAQILTEFRGEELGDSEFGKPLSVDIFKEGDLVSVVGNSKGRGFSGVMRRYNFAGAPGSRGSHEAFRHGGSIGMHTYPGRVYKGKKMAGRMGGNRINVKNVKIVRVDPDKKLLILSGAVPGPNGGIVRVSGLRSVKG